MATHNLKINLDKKEDRDGNTFYVGKLKVPANIDCSDGIAFLIFCAIEGEEELQISAMKKNDYEP
jgi:hypothetical protein